MKGLLCKEFIPRTVRKKRNSLHSMCLHSSAGEAERSRSQGTLVSQPSLLGGLQASERPSKKNADGPEE